MVSTYVMVLMGLVCLGQPLCSSVVIARQALRPAPSIVLGRGGGGGGVVVGGSAGVGGDVCEVGYGWTRMGFDLGKTASGPFGKIVLGVRGGGLAGIGGLGNIECHDCSNAASGGGDKFISFYIKDGQRTTLWNVSSTTPLGLLFKQYTSTKKTHIRLGHDFVRCDGRRIDVSKSALELNLGQGEEIRVETHIMSPPTGDELRPVWQPDRLRASAAGTPYGIKLKEWLGETLHLRGGYGTPRTYPQYEICKEEMDAAGEFAYLLEEFINATNTDAKNMAGPVALLLVEDGDADTAKFIFSTEWFNAVVNRTRQELAGSSWNQMIFSNATAMKKRYWQLICQEPSGLATRFPYHHPAIGEVLLAVHAEPVCLWFPTERIQIIGIAVNDISGMEEGVSTRDQEPGEAELDFTDVLQGEGNIVDTAFRATVQSCFDFLQHLVFNIRCTMCDALMQAFPSYANYTTVLNLHDRWQKTHKQLKGELGNISDPNFWLKDDIYTEDVDEICSKLGEWYREYREDNIKLLEQIKSGDQDDPSKPRVDTCAEPLRAPTDNSLDIARRFMSNNMPDNDNGPATFEADGLRLPVGTRSRIVD